MSSPRQITQRAAAAAQALKQVGDQLQDAMSDLIKSDMVVVRRNEFWIEVEIKFGANARSDVLSAKKA